MIKNNIRYDKTIEYYDGIKLFEARDPIGGTYVAYFLETRDQSDRYLVFGCEPDQLRLFRNGGIDLKSLMTESSIYGWYLADIIDFDEPLYVASQDSDTIPDDYLPQPGFFITGVEVNQDVTAKARQQDNIVIQVTIDPPETADEHRIRASTLSGLIQHVQTLTRYAVEHASREEEQAGKRATRNRDAHELDAIELSQGSTIITFQGARRSNTEDDPLLYRALHQLDHLFKNADTPDRAAATLAQYDPKVANAYLRLMKFLKTRKTGFSYTWATPRSTRPSHQALLLEKVEALAKEMESVLDKAYGDEGTDDVILEGTLKMADEPNKRWRLKDSELGIIKEGTVEKDGPSLSSLVIDGKYRFECQEGKTQAGSRSRKRSTLYLQSITLLDDSVD
jgi:hypothetical protein